MSVAKPGNLVKIVYGGLGEPKPGHKAPKKFDVYIDTEPEEDSVTEIVSANELLQMAEEEQKVS